MHQLKQITLNIPVEFYKTREMQGENVAFFSYQLQIMKISDTLETVITKAQLLLYITVIIN